MITPQSNMILIVSSSRGGSSVFAETLRRSRSLRHLAGEINPLLRLAGLSYPYSGTGSDALDARHDATHLRALLKQHVGVPAKDLDSKSEEVFAERLRWQWLDIEFRDEDIYRAVREARSMLPDVSAFTHAFIRALQVNYPIHPGLYDLPPQFQEGGAPLPRANLIEEPPFIPFQPWSIVGDERPFVVKAPSNAFRLDFFATHWPGLRLLHLTRNPASSINGLIDGWMHTGFHSHCVEGLAIDGYSNTVRGGKDWWKFDLFPGWEAYRTSALTEVCAAQWVGTHQAMLDWHMRNPGADVLQMRFEDFQRAPLEAVERFCRWAGIACDTSLYSAIDGGIPPVMATTPPRVRRWLDRADLLAPVLARPDVVSVADKLGYTDPTEWI